MVFTSKGAEIPDEDVPKSEDTKRLEAALADAKKNKDRAKMKSAKAEIKPFKEKDMQVRMMMILGFGWGSGWG